ncbi:MAG TPA: hypothetical protein VLA00_04205 [Xanthobacteraceae bacterium]|nr:hypothetical protein [Xanthobacteraceae bacterium]
MADQDTSKLTRRAVVIGAAGLAAAAAIPARAAPRAAPLAFHLARVEALLAGPDLLTRDAHSLAYAFQNHARALQALSPADGAFRLHAAEAADCRAWTHFVSCDVARPVLTSAFDALDAFSAAA